MDAAEYLNQIDPMCPQPGASRTRCVARHDPGLVDAAPGPCVRSVPLLTALRPPWLPVSSCSSPRAAPVAPEVLRFPGSAGCQLRLHVRLAGAPVGAVVCSWLPLSHDMGLIGLALYAMCSVNPPWSVPSDLVLMTPESFLADPASWMRACTDYRATTTTSPPFALRLAARSLRSGDVRPLLAAELRRRQRAGARRDLREFEAVAAGRSSPNVLCPGYGMAEAALAVAIDPTTAVVVGAVDRRGWPNGNGARSTPGGPSSSPVALLCTRWELRLAGRTGPRGARVRGPSLLSYFDPDAAPAAELRGFASHGRPGSPPPRGGVIAGRTDDVLIVAGRNIDARALDAVAGTRRPAAPGTPPASPMAPAVTSSWPSRAPPQRTLVTSAPVRERSRCAGQPVRRRSIRRRVH